MKKKVSMIMLFLTVCIITMQAQEILEGQKSQWNGCDRYDFKYQNRDAIVVVPQKVAKGRPWIWRPAFFNTFPSVDNALLAKGFHIVYYDLTHLYGSPRSVDLGNDFYYYLVQKMQLSEKVTLEGFSRGGLFTINWAAVNPDKVACIYVDAPVCNLNSWPGRQRADLWNDMLKEWNLTDTDMDTFKGNPIDVLAPIAKAGIPMLCVAGDSDQVVPFKDNGDVVRSRLLALGGSIETIIKKGCDHHPHSLDDPEPIVDFILRHQPAYEAYLRYTLRGSLGNSLAVFEKRRKGRVAFVGGSITEMNGWRNNVEQMLRQRFPYTEFEWIEAGISSTGTTPGAFRLQHDVLSKGKVDLLFVEAAVNDHTNGFNATEQVRGMEGEIRRARLANPEMDIIMLHFIYDPFIPMVAHGQLPDVVMNHERVANWYGIPSIRLVEEIGQRMQDGEFTWNDFGGTHPKPFGHKFYSAAIAHLFDEMWYGVSPDVEVKAHYLPELPLDTFSYYNGDFLDIKAARLGKGWQYVEKWHPEDKFEKRKGFVDVPMIEALTAGSRLRLDFEGRAIGIFCVSGPNAGVIEYSVDGAPYKQLDLFTYWSRSLYLPWVYMLETELEEGPHHLEIRIAKTHHSASTGTACQIRNFVVNR